MTLTLTKFTSAFLKQKSAISKNILISTDGTLNLNYAERIHALIVLIKKIFKKSKQQTNFSWLVWLDLCHIQHSLLQAE